MKLRHFDPLLTMADLAILLILLIASALPASPEQTRLDDTKSSQILSNTREKRATAVPVPQLWSNGVVPYVIREELDAFAVMAILHGMEYWTNSSCVKFKPRTNEESFLIFEESLLDNCQSKVGQISIKAPQFLHLTHKCIYIGGEVAHELGHVLGLWHEHQRTDRDEFIIVNNSNVAMGYETYFQKLDMLLFHDLDTPYDYFSLMHVTLDYLGGGKTTLFIRKNISLCCGQRNGMTSRDIHDINMLYNCSTNVSASVMVPLLPNLATTLTTPCMPTETQIQPLNTLASTASSHEAAVYSTTLFQLPVSTGDPQLSNSLSSTAVLSHLPALSTAASLQHFMETSSQLYQAKSFSLTTFTMDQSIQPTSQILPLNTALLPQFSMVSVSPNSLTQNTYESSTTLKTSSDHKSILLSPTSSIHPDNHISMPVTSHQTVVSGTIHTILFTATPIQTLQQEQSSQSPSAVRVTTDSLDRIPTATTTPLPQPVVYFSRKILLKAIGNGTDLWLNCKRRCRLRQCRKANLTQGQFCRSSIMVLQHIDGFGSGIKVGDTVMLRHFYDTSKSLVCRKVCKPSSVCGPSGNSVCPDQLLRILVAGKRIGEFVHHLDIISLIFKADTINNPWLGCNFADNMVCMLKTSNDKPTYGHRYGMSKTFQIFML